MTFNERLIKDRPEDVNFIKSHYCPETYFSDIPDFDCTKSEIYCHECWHREMPDPESNLLKIDTIVEGIPEHQPDKITREMVHELLDMVLDIQAAGDFACFTYSGHAIPVVSIGYTKGKFRESGFDYYTGICDSAINEYLSIMEKLKEIKNAPDAGTSKGSVQMDLE